VVTFHDDDVMTSCDIGHLYHCCYDDNGDDGDCLMRSGVCVVMNCDHVMQNVHVNESLCNNHDDHVNVRVNESLCDDHVNAHVNESLCDGVKKSDNFLSYIKKMGITLGENNYE